MQDHADVTELNLCACGINSTRVSNLRQCLRNITKLNLGRNLLGSGGAMQLGTLCLPAYSISVGIVALFQSIVIKCLHSILHA